MVIAAGQKCKRVERIEVDMCNTVLVRRLSTVALSIGPTIPKFDLPSSV